MTAATEEDDVALSAPDLLRGTVKSVMLRTIVTEVVVDVGYRLAHIDLPGMDASTNLEPQRPHRLRHGKGAPHRRPSVEQDQTHQVERPSE